MYNVTISGMEPQGDRAMHKPSKLTLTDVLGMTMFTVFFISLLFI
jgi:hypothetical protein